MGDFDQIIDIRGSEGPGELIPVAERRAILQGMVANSAVLQLANRVQMSTRVERQPVLSTLPDAYWVSEGGLKKTTKQEWDKKELVAEELAVIVPVYESQLADTNYDLWGEIRPRLVEAFGFKLDAAALFGTDAPTGFTEAVVPDAISADNTYSIGDSSVDLAEDINQVMSEVEADGFMVSGFAARTRLKGRLRGLRDQNNQVIFQPSLTAGTPATLYGEDVVYSDANGAWFDEGVDLIAGDWSKAVVGVRQDITFKLFTEGVISDNSGNVVLNLMQHDAVALRVVARYGFTVANPVSRFATDDATRYPFAVLETDEGS